MAAWSTKHGHFFLLDAVVGYMTDTVKNMEGSILRYLYPNNGVILNIQKALEKCLPDNAHQLASRRLHIFLTQVSGLQNVVVSEFSSKEEIIQVKVAFWVWTKSNWEFDRGIRGSVLV